MRSAAGFQLVIVPSSVVADDRVVRGLDDRGQLACVLLRRFTLSQFLVDGSDEPLWSHRSPIDHQSDRQR